MPEHIAVGLVGLKLIPQIVNLSTANQGLSRIPANYKNAYSL